MTEPKYISQHGQDKYVDQHFSQKRNGVFVDVGAHDGLTINNTLFFEQHRGWTGLCVEANPTVYAQLVVNRPNVITEHAAAYHSDQDTIAFTQIKGYAEMLSGVGSSYDPRHENRINSELKERGGERVEIQVPCMRLDTMFQKHGISHVDYLSIDTEGSEIHVLKGIDWRRVYIDVVGVEVNYGTESLAIHAFMRQLGLYEPLHHVGGDWLFKRRQIKAEPILFSLNEFIEQQFRFVSQTGPFIPTTSHIYSVGEHESQLMANIAHSQVRELVVMVITSFGWDVKSIQVSVSPDSSVVRYNVDYHRVQDEVDQTSRQYITVLTNGMTPEQIQDLMVVQIGTTVQSTH